MATVTFEKALQKLEESVRKLEDGSIGLEEALKTFEEGINWSRQCHGRLAEAEKRVEILLKEDKEAMTQVAFDLDDEE